MMLYNFSCNTCNHIFEELIATDEPNPNCPLCNSSTTITLATNTTYGEPNACKYWEMRQKMLRMKNKMSGKTPWRKHSESQTD